MSDAREPRSTDPVRDPSAGRPVDPSATGAHAERPATTPAGFPTETRRSRGSNWLWIVLAVVVVVLLLGWFFGGWGSGGRTSPIATDPAGVTTTAPSSNTSQ